MIENTNPEIDVEVLMQRIRAEVALRKARSQSVTLDTPKITKTAIPTDINVNNIIERITLSKLPETAVRLKQKERYTVTDFLNFHDEDFVRNAFHGILRRDADAGGLMHYLTSLRNGSLSKLEILGRLRYSREGRIYNVHISGLLSRFAIKTAYRIPVLGYILSLANFFIRLPVFINNWQRFEAFVNQQERDQRAQMNRVITQIEDSFQIVQQRSAERFRAIDDNLVKANAGVDDIRRLVSKKTDVVEFRALSAQLAESLAQKADGTQLTELAAQLAEGLAQKADGTQLTELAAQLAEDLAQKTDGTQILGELSEIRQEILGNKLNILDQQRRLALLLEEARKRLPAPITQNQIEAIVAEEDHLLDALYVSFEDNFRGTREDIKKRSEIYVPIVREAQAGTKVASILDIGCGRGEWLEVLGENGLVAKGIDLNRIMVAQCQELNLDVSEAEAITYLRSLKSNSLGAVTGIHIIEHIPFRRLVVLFDEVLRVLKPGGVVIFETPNPENIIVGACNFYFDPTHLNPLPPLMVQFLAEARGFVRVGIKRLSTNRNHRSLVTLNADESCAEKINPIIQIAQDSFFCAPDYAIVAYKS
ncbi:methyltransferase domain-containing protein [Methylobacter marinus]|uniref:methyltransferase domain-containing protein n=1 Tax=Methylobacter marinus TaxID=34058 RepID=UPI00036E21F0|nr:methyltransferase domain-containing protein [Methylobacter marinus]